MSEPYRDILYECRDGVGILTLNRPHHRNALSPEMKEDLLHLMTTLQYDRDLKALIITGAGGAFCAGAELGYLNDVERTADWDRRRVHQVHDWFQRILTLEVPVIAAVDGPAYGAGFGLALGADFILMSDRARLCCVFSRIGLVPDLGVFFTLPRIVGMQRAKELMYTNRPVFAQEAKALGIALEVHPHDDLMAAALALAGRFRTASTAAIGATKRIVTQSFNLDAAALVELEATTQALFLTTDYHKQAVADFVAKRPLAFNWEAMDKAEQG